MDWCERLETAGLDLTAIPLAHRIIEEDTLWRAIAVTDLPVLQWCLVQETPLTRNAWYGCAQRILEHPEGAVMWDLWCSAWPQETDYLQGLEWCVTWAVRGTCAAALLHRWCQTGCRPNGRLQREILEVGRVDLLQLYERYWPITEGEWEPLVKVAMKGGSPEMVQHVSQRCPAPTADQRAQWLEYLFHPRSSTTYSTPADRAQSAELLCEQWSMTVPPVSPRVLDSMVNAGEWDLLRWCRRRGLEVDRALTEVWGPEASLPETGAPVGICWTERLLSGAVSKPESLWQWVEDGGSPEIVTLSQKHPYTIRSMMMRMESHRPADLERLLDILQLHFPMEVLLHSAMLTRSWAICDLVYGRSTLDLATILVPLYRPIRYHSVVVWIGLCAHAAGLPMRRLSERETCPSGVVGVRYCRSEEAYWQWLYRRGLVEPPSADWASVDPSPYGCWWDEYASNPEQVSVDMDDRTWWWWNHCREQDLPVPHRLYQCVLYCQLYLQDRDRHRWLVSLIPRLENPDPILLCRTDDLTHLVPALQILGQLPPLSVLLSDPGWRAEWPTQSARALYIQQLSDAYPESQLYLSDQTLCCQTEDELEGWTWAPPLWYLGPEPDWGQVSRHWQSLGYGVKGGR